LDTLDKRTAAFKKACALEAELCRDLGGVDQLGAARRQMTRNASILGVVIEDFACRWIGGDDEIDIANWLAAMSVQRRLLVTVGLNREPRVIDELTDEDRELEALADEVTEEMEAAS